MAEPGVGPILSGEESAISNPFLAGKEGDECLSMKLGAM
jgi:hypothetical protein